MWGWWGGMTIQGGAVALSAAVRSGQTLAGVLALSAWLPKRLPALPGGGPSSNPGAGSAAAAAVPALFCHGKEDGVVRFDLGRDSCRRAAALGLTVSFRSVWGLGFRV